MVGSDEEERSGSINLFENDEDILKFKAVITYERYYNSDTTWGVYGFYTNDDIPQYTKETKMDLPFEDRKEVDPDKKFSSLAGKMQELVVGGEYMVKARSYTTNKRVTVNVSAIHYFTLDCGEFNKCVPKCSK